MRTQRISGGTVTMDDRSFEARVADQLRRELDAVRGPEPAWSGSRVSLAVARRGDGSPFATAVAAIAVLAALALITVPLLPADPGATGSDAPSAARVDRPAALATAPASAARTAIATRPPRGASESAAPVGDFGLSPPPPVVVRAGDASFDLRAWSYCYGNGCVDGQPPADLPHVGRPDRIEVEFPLEDWSFRAEFVPVGVSCPRRQWVPVEKTGDHTFVLGPAGRADIYDVTLFGRGDGDLFVTFRWQTRHDGPMPVPDARLAILADHDGNVDSYGVELELSDLRSTPEAASAEVTVIAANGRSLTFVPERVDGCASEGVVYWDGPDGAGKRAAKLGPPPFTYRVVVVLDGVRYTGHATWPANVIPGNEPSAALTFSPPLPALP
jgi:hypothetical protein